MMEEKGIVSKANHVGKREVLKFETFRSYYFFFLYLIKQTLTQKKNLKS